MERKKWFSVGVGIVVIIVIGVAIGIGWRPRSASPRPIVKEVVQEPVQSAPLVPVQTITSSDVVGSAGGSFSKIGAAHYRAFTINIGNEAYTPSTIIVERGDSVSLTVKAIDKNYDLVQPQFGINMSIEKGQTSQVEFPAMTPGKYTFYCALCGGPNKGPLGYIIVK